MMWLGFEVLINLFEACLILYYIKSRIRCDKSNVLSDVVCILCCATYYSLYLFFEMPLNDIAVYSIPLLYALFFSSDRWYVSLYWIIILAILFTSTPGIVTHLFMSIFSLSLEELAYPSRSRFFAIIINNIALFVIIFSVSQLKREYCYMSWKALFVFLLASACVLIVEEVLFYLQQFITGFSVLFNVGYIALLCSSLLLILLFHYLTTSTMRENEFRSEINLLATTKQHQIEFSQMYYDFISRQHDFKHQLETIEELIFQNNKQDAYILLKEYKAKLRTSQSFITGNITIDALLTVKYLTMKNNNILFKFVSYPLNLLPIPITDFCSIIGNLLDNAIEASLRINDPFEELAISLSFSRMYGVFRIVCKNRCNPSSLHNENGIWKSSKNENAYSSVHGLGIPSIIRIVSRYDGYSNFYHDGAMFIADVSIPYSIQNEEEE